MSETSEDQARIAAEVFPPSTFIREEVEARGWTDDEAMDRLRWGPLVWRSVMDGTYAIDEALADDLEHAFGVSRVYWLNLERMWRARRAANSEPASDVEA